MATNKTYSNPDAAMTGRRRRNTTIVAMWLTLPANASVVGSGEPATLE